MIRINKTLWVFPSRNPSTELTSWWIDFDDEPILIDCPEMDEALKGDLQKLAAGRSPKIILTGRDAHTNFKKLRGFFDWHTIVHEQEAYLLPGLEGIQTFSNEFTTDSGLKVLWTPGPSPGSCIAYAPAPTNVLFSGRLLIPVGINQLAALRTKRTFHWSMQQKSLAKMRDWLPSNSLPNPKNRDR